MTIGKKAGQITIQDAREEEARKRKPGRYTLQESAKKIAESTGTGYRQILDMLILSALRGELTVYRTNQGAPFTPKLKYDAHFSEATWNDLNEWMLRKKIECDFKFPNPNTNASSPEPQTPQGEIGQNDTSLSAGNPATRFIEIIIATMEAKKKRVTVSAIWLECRAWQENSIIEDTKPDAYLCNIGAADLYPITKGAIKGILQRYRERQRNA